MSANVLAWRSIQTIDGSKLILGNLPLKASADATTFLVLLLGPYVALTAEADDTRINRMMDSLPIYYQFSTAMNDIQKTISGEIGGIDTNEDDLKYQFNVNTATWGLKYWEEEVNLPSILSDSLEIRRSRVLAKRRGIGNYSAPLLKSIISSFINAEVDVTVDIPNYNIIITFVGRRGIPPNLPDVVNAIEEVIHAHIGYEMRFTYLIWNELDSQKLTWNALDAKNWTWTQFEKWRPPIN